MRSKGRTTEPHLTAHTQSSLHHLADAFITQDTRESSRETVSQDIEDLQEDDFVRY